MFGEERNYGNYKSDVKTCALCNDGFPLKTYATCDGCGKFFCFSHRPLFAKEWFCPLCEDNFKAFVQPLKEANTIEFFKRLG
jgi:hypothetical protein